MYEGIGLSAILAVGFFLVRDHATTVGATTAAALYFHRLFGPMGALMMTFDQVQSAGASLARLVGVADIELPATPAEPARPRDSGVTVVGLTHHYERGPKVLDDVSLHIAPGERVALVGASGAGKTTFASIVAGLLEPSDGPGAVRIGGVRFDELGETRWRQQVALISQDVDVFSGSLIDDVRLAAPDASLEDVHDALARVGATGWVAALSNGVDTVVGEPGGDTPADAGRGCGPGDRHGARPNRGGRVARAARRGRRPVRDVVAGVAGTGTRVTSSSRVGPIGVGRWSAGIVSGRSGLWRSW